LKTERDIATSNVSLGPVYDYSNNRQRIRAYQLTNIVTVTVRNLDVLGDVLDDGVTAGATSVEGITFDVADRAASEAQAREAAVKDAKAKAETLAAGVGVRISGVASMSESVSTPIWYDRTFAGAAVAEDAAATPVLAGSTDVTISVSVSFSAAARRANGLAHPFGLSVLLLTFAVAPNESAGGSARYRRDHRRRPARSGGGRPVVRVRSRRFAVENTIACRRRPDRSGALGDDRHQGFGGTARRGTGR
jgi:hypothetical protein